MGTGAEQQQSRKRSERGIALVTAILALVVLSLMALATAFTTTSAISASRSYERQSQALFVAEAGGAHALDMIRNVTVGLPAGLNPILLGPDGAGDTDDDGSLSDVGRSGGPIFDGMNAIPISSPGFALGSGNYFARAYDDDDPAVNLGTPADENGDRFSDANGRIIVRVTGHGEGRSEAVVDYLIGRRPLPVILVNGQLEMEHDTQVLGKYGSIHSNCLPPPDFNPNDLGLDLEGQVTIAKNATSSCQASAEAGVNVNGTTTTNQALISMPTLKLPAVSPADPYSPEEVNLPALSDIILVGDETDVDDGNQDTPDNILRAVGITPGMVAASGVDPTKFIVVRTVAARNMLPAGTCPSLPCFLPLPDSTATANSLGWALRDGHFQPVGNMTQSNGLTVLGVGEDFYFRNDVGTAGAPLVMTILAVEQLHIENVSVHLTPALVINQAPFRGAPLQFWADEQVHIQGLSSLNLSGVLYAGEEFDCWGTGNIEGQVLVAGLRRWRHGGGGDVDEPGNLRNNCIVRLDNPMMAVGTWSHTGWRQIKR